MLDAAIFDNRAYSEYYSFRNEIINARSTLRIREGDIGIIELISLINQLENINQL